jgi:peptidoglycan/xylan/chitin deacetylase (PgdA/CDA1 family)
LLFAASILVSLVFTSAAQTGTADGEAPVAGSPGGGFKLAVVEPVGEETEAKRIALGALTRIAEIQGVPYEVVGTPGGLSVFSAAALAKAPSNAELTPAWREALYSFVEEGGVLLVPGLPGSDLYSLLGISDVESSKRRERMRFVGGGAEGSGAPADPLLAYIDHPNEFTISLGNGREEVYDRVIWSHGAEADGMSELLASFDDGSAALVRSYYGRGIAYYLGVSFAETVLLPQTGGDYEAQRKFVNSVEPSADVIMLLLKALYEEYVRHPVYISPIPGARRTALLLSHDVDAQTSFVDSLKFARLAEEYGAHGTFFINTKYFEDSMDIAYYSVPENLDAVRELKQRGHEIGSHTVAHSLDFDSAPVGSARVDFESYEPGEAISINGEVRVSKELLDEDLPGQNTVSFRAGYLAFPQELIGVLEAAGYRYDSSFSANDVLTTFPYYALRERRPGAEESDIIEIPVTFDDALGFLTRKRREEAVASWKRIMRAHADNETISVLLIHPSDTRDKRYKLQAQRELMEYASEMAAWMGSIEEFGDFWRARSHTRVVDVSVRDGVLSVGLNLPVEKLHPWTGLVLSPSSEVRKIVIRDAEGQTIPHERRRVEGKKWFLRLEL